LFQDNALMSTLPNTCPRCGEPIGKSRRSGLLICGGCGYIPGVTKLDSASPTESFAFDDPGDDHVGGAVSLPTQITYRGELGSRALGLYQDGVAAAARGAVAQALDHFHDALDIEPEFVDAHMAIARLSADAAVQREHLGAALAHDPGNGEALRLWMLLRGDLTPEGAARAARGETPELRRADAPMTTQTTVLLCPVCSGHMTVDDDTQQVTCRFCGHAAPARERVEVGGRSLGAALIARKAEPVRWVIGERLLHCNECGAERTISATTLSMECPFCGSNQVIKQDAVSSFVQPDGLIPFALDERAVVAALKRALDAPLEKLAGMLDDNRVKTAIIDPVFVPFWVFDVIVDIRRTVVDVRIDQVGRFGGRPIQPREENFTDALFNLPIQGMKELDEALMARIDRYDFSQVKPYEPGLLAKQPASLYDVDFDAASLSARSSASETMRQKHDVPDSQTNGSVSVFAQVQSMSFSLLLLPVFVVTMKERDGDRRAALVNGQTGVVALGKTEKRRR
jgi:DNA-directed RNA polymerase subunit RPC12/RpoP